MGPRKTKADLLRGKTEAKFLLGERMAAIQQSLPLLRNKRELTERETQQVQRAAEAKSLTEVVSALVVLVAIAMWVNTRTEPKRPRGFILDLLMPPDRAEDALFNILGRYDYWVEKHGSFRARCIFLTQSLGAVLSFWTDWLLKRAKLLRFLRPS